MWRHFTLCILPRRLCRFAHMLCSQSGRLPTYEHIYKKATLSQLTRLRRDVNGVKSLSCRSVVNKGRRAVQQWQKFGIRFQREASLFWRYQNSLRIQCRISRQQPMRRKPARYVQPFGQNTGWWRTDMGTPSHRPMPRYAEALGDVGK